MIRINIKDLHLRTIIGVNDWEREKVQDLLLNIELDTDTDRSGQTDDLADACNYKTLTKRVVAHVEGSRYHLLERLGDALLDLIMGDPKILRASVRIDKPHALRFAESVSVQMFRERE